MIHYVVTGVRAEFPRLVCPGITGIGQNLSVQFVLHAAIPVGILHLSVAVHIVLPALEAVVGETTYQTEPRSFSAVRQGRTSGWVRIETEKIAASPAPETKFVEIPLKATFELQKVVTAGRGGRSHQASFLVGKPNVVVISIIKLLITRATDSHLDLIIIAADGFPTVAFRLDQQVAIHIIVPLLLFVFGVAEV